MCGGHHHVTHAQRRRVDPTQTVLLRRSFEKEMTRRFKRFAKSMRDHLESQRIVTNAYEFTRDDAKVKRFLDWLRRQASKDILGLEYGTPLSTASNMAWSNIYIKAAYQKGMARSASRLRQAGASVEDTWVHSSFNRPIHAERVGLIYTRSFTDLQGVTAAMDQKMSRVLAQSMIEGLGVQETAKKLNDVVKSIGINRARVIARTEVIAAHAEATLNGYEEAGVEGVDVEAEFSTSRDNSVCPKCKALEGKIVKVSEAHGLIPLHPNCRCAWQPIVRDPRGIILR